MTYRSRGGKNGTGGIIRPNPQTIQTREIRYTDEDDPTTYHHQVSSSQNLHQQHTTPPENSMQFGTTGNEETTTTASINNMQSEMVSNMDPNSCAGTTISDETGNPEVKLVLHPDDLWFEHHDVVKLVSETSYKTYFKGPYYNWSKTPPEVKQRWWNAFKHEFSWDSSIAWSVKKDWQSKCSRRLTSIMCKVCKDEKYGAAWCAPTIRERFKEIRRKDGFKKKSSQFSKNIISNACEKAHHRQGSISAQEVKLKLEKKLNRTPTAAELYFKSHADDDGKFVNAKAQQCGLNLRIGKLQTKIVIGKVKRPKINYFMRLLAGGMKRLEYLD